jgi:hypothetical protein
LNLDTTVDVSVKKTDNVLEMIPLRNYERLMSSTRIVRQCLS